MRGSTAISAACGKRGFRLARIASTRVEPVADRVLRDALQVQVERRVDVDGAGGLGALLQLLRQVVDEIRRLGLERARDDLHRLARRAVGVVRA